MKRALIIGAGGHARVIASLLADQAEFEIAGILDSSTDFLGQKIGADKIVGSFDDLQAWCDKGVKSVAIALGDNQERAEWHARADQLGLDIVSLQHPTSIVEKSVQLGRGVIICAGSILAADVKVGEGVIVNTGAIVDHESSLGDFCHIAPGCRLAGRVSVGNAAFVGIGSSIRDNISIGKNSILGAGSVVISSIPDDVTAHGSPAKVQSNG
jgi:UDP-N-acetylbacillosamine N-acetyltransferase